MYYFIFYSCLNKSSHPVPCAPGFYSSTSATECSKCPLGTMCPELQTITPLPCTNGTYSNTTGALDCTRCPMGYSCLNPRNTPEVCQEGYYSPLGTAVCSTCPSGYRYGTSSPYLKELSKLRINPLLHDFSAAFPDE